MAITILDQPTALSLRPAFAPIEYLVSSTNTAESGFKMVCRIRYNGTIVSTLLLDTIPNTTKVILTAQNIIKSFNNSVYSLISGDIVNLQTITLGTFDVQFQEFYDGALQGSTVTSSSIDTFYSSPKYTEFASGKYLERQLSNIVHSVVIFSAYSDRVIADSGTVENNACTINFIDGIIPPRTYQLFLSGYGNYKLPSEAFNNSSYWMKIKPSQKIQAGFLVSTSGNNFKVLLQTFDANNSSLGSNTLLVSIGAGQYALDVGFNELALHDWVSPLSLTGVKKYAISVLNIADADEPVSVTYLYELDECVQYTPFEIHWLNRHGGYDSFVFSGKSKHETSNTKTMAKAKPNRLSGDTIQYLTSAIQSRPFHVSTQDMFTLSSRIIRDFEVAGFEDMFSSPEVYWNSPDGFINVNIKGDIYEHRTTENGQVFNIEAQFDIASNERQW